MAAERQEELEVYAYSLQQLADVAAPAVLTLENAVCNLSWTKTLEVRLQPTE